MTAVQAGDNNQSAQKNGKTDLQCVVPVEATLLTESLPERLHNRIIGNLDCALFIDTVWKLLGRGTIIAHSTNYRGIGLRDLFVISFHLFAFNLFEKYFFYTLTGRSSA